MTCMDWLLVLYAQMKALKQARPSLDGYSSRLRMVKFDEGEGVDARRY